jgi:thiol-disulfide isomerase/thioredoxin
MKLVRYLFLLLSMSATAANITPGHYRATLQLAEQVELPFHLEIKLQAGEPVLLISNAEDRFVVDDIHYTHDTLLAKMPEFDTELQFVAKGSQLSGVWINHYRTTDNSIPFSANLTAEALFKNTAPAAFAYEGQWEVYFGQDEAKTPAIGVFRKGTKTNEVYGTFLTETGDYRFLEGCVSGKELWLACFDGNHAYLFHAVLQDDGSLKGSFRSGRHYQETWTARRNADFKLRDPENISFVKKDTPIAFTFKNLKGETVALSDERYKNKPVIIQLMGSWCPNCLDESRYLSALYKQYQAKGLEVVAICFEKSEDFEKSQAQVSRMATRTGITYQVLLSGKSGKNAATLALPWLSEVAAFPTTIFLNRAHQAVKVHTGFSGPATGEVYAAFTRHTEQFIEQLIRE